MGHLGATAQNSPRILLAFERRRWSISFDGAARKAGSRQIGGLKIADEIWLGGAAGDGFYING
jgi:hypothetical protein